MSIKTQNTAGSSKCKRHSKQDQQPRAESSESVHNSQMLQEVKILQAQLDNFKTLKSVRQKELIAEHSKAINKIKAQLQQCRAELGKAKKTQGRLENINFNLTKKVNLLESRLSQSQKHIEGLNTVKQLPKQPAKTKASKPKDVEGIPEVSKVPEPHPFMQDQDSNWHSLQLQLRILKEQNSSLKGRIKILENERQSAQNVFQPLLKESSQQVRTLIHQKNKLLVQNAELSEKVVKLTGDAAHFQKVYKTMETNFTKLQRQYLVLSPQQPVHTASNRDDSHYRLSLQARCKQVQSKNLQIQQQLSQLHATKANLEEYVKHLETTNRYLAGENRKLISLRQSPGIY